MGEFILPQLEKKEVAFFDIFKVIYGEINETIRFH